MKNTLQPLVRQYLLIFLSVALASSLLLGYLFWDSYRHTGKAVEASLQSTVGIVETRLVATLQRMDGDLRELAATIPVEALSQTQRERYSAQVTRELEMHAQLFPEVNAYRIYDAEGNDLYYSGPRGPRHNVAERSYFRALKAQPSLPIHFSEVIIGKITKTPVMPIAKPLLDSQGRFLGVVLASVDMGYYVKLFSHLDLGAKSATALRRAEDGALVVRWPVKIEDLNVPLKPGHALREQLAAGTPAGLVKMTAQTDRIERIYAFKRLVDYPLVVISGSATADYLQPWWRTLLITLTVALLALSALGSLLYRQMHNQQNELAANHELLTQRVILQRAMSELEDARDVAETASRAKSTFLANMSHELRTPMTAIMGMVDLALRRSNDPKQTDQLRKAKQASQHLLAVINDILDISKIEAEHLALEKISFRLGTVMENLVSLVANKVSEKSLRLHIDLSPEVAQQTLLGDPLRLGQILLNFTGNAIKFTAHGDITVRVRQIDQRPSEVTLRFEIADTGIGISADDQARLFTAFEQADGSMTRKYGGTGLGLAISKRLANLMGGETGVTSAQGAGSTFWFTVRLGIASDAVLPAPTFTTASAEAQLKASYAGARILLAEDEPVNREVSLGLLEDAGLAVDIAEDGVIALALARQTDYALILMDMQMPNLNGVDATREIRRESLNMDTPILAMTANAFNEDRQLCIDAGMNDHIAKPVDPDVLFETLLKWLK